MSFPPPSAQSSIASGADKSSSSRSTRPQQFIWGSSASQPNSRRGLTPLATSNFSTSGWASPRGLPQTSSPGPGSGSSTSISSSLSSTYPAVQFATRFGSSNYPTGGRNAPSPASTPAPFSSLHHSTLQQHQQSGQSVSSPKVRAHTPSSIPSLTSATTSVTGGGGTGGGGGGTGPSRGAAFSPSSSGRTVNSPTGFPSDRGNPSSLAKISIAQVFLLLDSITDKEGKEKWETKASQIHKVSIYNKKKKKKKKNTRCL